MNTEGAERLIGAMLLEYLHDLVSCRQLNPEQVLANLEGKSPFATLLRTFVESGNFSRNHLKCIVAAIASKWESRQPENIGIYLLYRMSCLGEKNKQKRSEIMRKKRNKKSWKKLTAEDVRGTWLTQDNLKQLTGKEVKMKRISKQIQQHFDNIELFETKPQMAGS